MTRYYTLDQEKLYIRRRKLKAFRESLLYYFFRIFPIKRKRITVTTYEGRSGFCCNPKYIVMELHKRDPELEFIWLVNDPDSREFPDYIRKAKNDIWHRAYYLTTSKVWIDNYRKPLGDEEEERAVLCEYVAWKSGVQANRTMERKSVFKDSISGQQE